MASGNGALLLRKPYMLLALCASTSGATLEKPSCNFQRLLSLRSEWGSVGEPCHKKLPCDLWTLMKAEGSAMDPEARDVWANCRRIKEVGLLELTTPKGYLPSEAVIAAPGSFVSETEHASTYEGATAISLEAFCEDENITKVTRVGLLLTSYNKSKPRNPRRHLQATTSEAGQAHQVAELISGLQALGCSRTTGEDQTLCVMSDGFDALGNADSLQESGDLPEVDVVKEYFYSVGKDEGSAMIEIAYDIASGANYKFSSARLGEQTMADDIGVLAGEEGCDVIVDDVLYYNEPAFRDGVVALAVDAAVDSGSLFFTSAGNQGMGYRFASNFECAAGMEEFFAEGAEACEDNFVASHVFQPDLDSTDVHRYLWKITSVEEQIIQVHWDADTDTDQDIAIAIYYEEAGTDALLQLDTSDLISGGLATERIKFLPLENDSGEDYNYYLQMIHYGPTVGYIDADFVIVSSEGISGSVDGAILGHACASNCIPVAAIGYNEATGSSGTFADPETGLVEDFSSRGPCIVSGETRSKPTTCAADDLAVSTPSFPGDLGGTSASAPVAAAIATIVRAACYPRVVTYADVMEMLTNYDYTIDYTNDAGGVAEAWGIEAGHGIISASKMLAWVKANCGDACPGSDDVEGAISTEVEVGTKTTVSVEANSYDSQPGESSGQFGCLEDGCRPSLTRDGISDVAESRWSCASDIVPGGGQCKIKFMFASSQDIVDMQVAFWKGDERIRTLKVYINDIDVGDFTSYPGSTFNSFDIQESDVDTVAFELVTTNPYEWIALLEVRFFVKP